MRRHLLFSKVLDTRNVLYLLISLAYGVRAWQIIRFNPMQHLWSDPMRHWQQASETLQTGPMAFFDPIAYQLWLSAVQKLTVGIPELIAAVTILLSWVTPWFWYRALREAICSKTLALTGWALLAWSPSWIVIYSYFMTETLFLPLLGLSIWQTLRSNRKKSASAFSIAVCCWAAAMLTRGVALPIAAVALFWVWLNSPAKIRSAVNATVIAVVLICPIGYRNYYSVGLWSPFGNGWLNRIYACSGKQEIRLDLERKGARWYYGFGSPSMGEQPFAPWSAWTSERTGTVYVTADLTRNDRDWKYAETVNCSSQSPWLYKESMIYLFWGASWPDNDPSQPLAQAQIVQRWIWGPLLLTILGLTFTRLRDVKARPIVPAMLLVWVLVQGLGLFVVNEGRYRKPVEGLMILQLLMLLERRRPKICSGSTASNQ